MPDRSDHTDSPDRPGRPNILHILSDQHSPYVAGCYGDPVVQTPHLNRLAATGAVFDAAYCPSPICVPSRMSLLTGRHPSQNECWTNSDVDRAPPPRHPRPSSPDHPYFRWWRAHTGIEDVSAEEVGRCRAAYWPLTTAMHYLDPPASPD